MGLFMYDGFYDWYSGMWPYDNSRAWIWAEHPDATNTTVATFRGIGGPFELSAGMTFPTGLSPDGVHYWGAATSWDVSLFAYSSTQSFDITVDILGDTFGPMTVRWHPPPSEGPPYATTRNPVYPTPVVNAYATMDSSRIITLHWNVEEDPAFPIASRRFYADIFRASPTDSGFTYITDYTPGSPMNYNRPIRYFTDPQPLSTLGGTNYRIDVKEPVVGTSVYVYVPVEGPEIELPPLVSTGGASWGFLAA